MLNMLEIVNPFDLSVITQVPLSNQQEAEQMLKTAQIVFKDRTQWLTTSQRINILKNLANAVREQAPSFAQLIAKEGGKPLMDATIEVHRAVDGIEMAIHVLAQGLHGSEIPMGLTPATEGRQAWTTYEPVGVVLALSAFNHPLNLIVHQVVPAVAVGCPIIIKPASSTPLTAIKFCELLIASGLPQSWCQLIVCNNTVAQYLATHDDINFLSFIGSAKVGWMLRNQLAPGVRCALEHGGVAPVIVDETVSIQSIIPALTKGAFYHAGQVCVSVQRIYAHDSIAKELAEALSKSANQLKVGDASLPDTEVGPLITPQEVTRVKQWVDEAVQAGGTLLTGGQPLSTTLFQPTVIYNPPKDAKVSTQEVFGPIVCIYSYQELDDAIEQANALPYAFQASIFTKDLNNATKTAQRLNATAVMVNDHTAFRADWMPFGGRDHSGYGLGGIPYTMRDLVQVKMVVTNPSQ